MVQLELENYLNVIQHKVLIRLWCAHLSSTGHIFTKQFNNYGFPYLLAFPSLYMFLDVSCMLTPLFIILVFHSTFRTLKTAQFRLYIIQLIPQISHLWHYPHMIYRMREDHVLYLSGLQKLTGGSEVSLLISLSFVIFPILRPFFLNKHLYSKFSTFSCI